MFCETASLSKAIRILLSALWFVKNFFSAEGFLGKIKTPQK